MVEEQRRMPMSCPYKWHSRRSFLMVLHSSISKKAFHVLNKISICQRNEYNGCTYSVGTSSSAVFLIYTFMPIERLLFSFMTMPFFFSRTAWFFRRIPV